MDILRESARDTVDELTAWLHGNQAVSIELVRDNLRRALADTEPGPQE